MHSCKADVAGFELIDGLAIILRYLTVALAGQGHEDLYSRTAHRAPNQVAHIVGVHTPAEHLDHVLSSTVRIIETGSVYLVKQRCAAHQVDTALELFIPGMHIVKSQGENKEDENKPGPQFTIHSMPLLLSVRLNQEQPAKSQVTHKNTAFFGNRGEYYLFFVPPIIW